MKAARIARLAGVDPTQASASANARPATELLLASGLSLACALIHVQAAVDHLDESLLYSILFVAVAAAQAAWGVALLRGPEPRILWAGAVGIVGVIVAWIFSRTLGLPVGPDTAGPESAGLLDVLATLNEVAILALLGATVYGPRLGARTPPMLRWLALMLLLFSSLVLAAGTHAH